MNPLTLNNRMKKIYTNNFTIFISNLNAILFFVGFPIFTTIFYGYEITKETSLLTIGYRVFTTVLAFVVIYKNKEFPKLNSIGKLFLFFWIAYLIRIIFDLYLRSDNFYIPNNQKLIYINDSVLTCFLPMLAIFSSYKNIRWRKIFLFVLISLIFLITYGLINQSTNPVRNKMNVAVNELSFGYYSAAAFLAGLTLLRSKESKSKSIATKLFYILIMLLSIFSLGAAGSRGPLLGLIFALILAPLVRNPLRFGITLFLGYLIFLIFQETIVEFLQDNFAVLFERTAMTFTANDISGREYIFQDAINQIKSHPILGDWHLLYYKNSQGNFAHNAILDAWMSLGIFIGSIIIILYLYFIKISIKLINNRTLISFIGYITLLSIGYSLTTGGALPYKDVFNFSFSFLILTTLPQANFNQENSLLS